MLDSQKQKKILKVEFDAQTGKKEKILQRMNLDASLVKILLIIILRIIMHVCFYLSLMQSEYQMACIWHICEKGKYWVFLKFEQRKKQDSIRQNFFLL